MRIKQILPYVFVVTGTNRELSNARAIGRATLDRAKQDRARLAAARSRSVLVNPVSLSPEDRAERQIRSIESCQR